MKITPEQEALVKAEFDDEKEAEKFLSIVKLLCPECKDEEGGLLKDGKCQVCGYVEKFENI